MPTRAENLETALDNIAQILADITANPKPTYSVAGRNIGWTEYFSALITQQKELEQALQRASESGRCFEVRTHGRS